MSTHTFFDGQAAQSFLVDALEHYIPLFTPPWFTTYLDMDLYARLGDERWKTITLDELVTVQNLLRDGEWLSPALATESLYMLFNRLGRDTISIY